MAIYEDDHEFGLTALEVETMVKDAEKFKINLLLAELDKLLIWHIDAKKQAVYISTNSIAELVILTSKIATLYTDYKDYCQQNMEM